MKVGYELLQSLKERQIATFHLTSFRELLRKAEEEREETGQSVAKVSIGKAAQRGVCMFSAMTKLDLTW